MTVVKKRGARGKKISSPRSELSPIPSANAEHVATRDRTGGLPDAGLEEEIRQRAYELYEARGRTEGFDQEDWNRAKAEVLSRHRA